MQGTGSIPGDGSPDGQSWAARYRTLVEQPIESFDAADLEELAIASYLMGDDDHCAAGWEAAHRQHADAGRSADAARCAFWLAFGYMLRGQMAQAGGWLGRAESMLDDETCSASGFVLLPRLLRSIDEGDAPGARVLAARAANIAATVGDADLAALARLGDGQACIALGEVATATARFDDAMLMVTAGEVGPISRGVVYCAVVLECMHLFDLRRAAEWTDALAAWCAEQPEMVPYRGQCLVHRSQLLQASGEWTEAAETIESACRRLAEPPHPALGLAHYQTAELHRLVGSFDDAAEAYGRASAAGHEPMPGLALLALTSLDVEAAATGISRALQETELLMRRPALLAAAVEIFRETNDLPAARIAADELGEIAARHPADVLTAMARHASGSVTLAEGDPAAALSLLREAHTIWSHAHMPYEAARTSVLLGLGCLAFGDRASAALEFDNARRAFESLGARPDLERLQALTQRAAVGQDRPDEQDDTPLSSRELEVLAHVASGKTNREIAADLSISQHTVGRHLENIFAKLGVSSRAAATAYAYEHQLL